MRTIAAVEAKAKFSALLDAAQRGKRITVTRRGKPVAVIVPASTRRIPAGPFTPKSVIREIVLKSRGSRLGENVRDAIEAGRRY